MGIVSPWETQIKITVGALEQQGNLLIFSLFNEICLRRKSTFVLTQQKREKSGKPQYSKQITHRVF